MHVYEYNITNMNTCIETLLSYAIYVYTHTYVCICTYIICIHYMIQKCVELKWTSYDEIIVFIPCLLKRIYNLAMFYLLVIMGSVTKSLWLQGELNLHLGKY